MTLQRIRIIVEDDGLEPGTSAGFEPVTSALEVIQCVSDSQ